MLLVRKSDGPEIQRVDLGSVGQAFDAGRHLMREGKTTCFDSGQWISPNQKLTNLLVSNELPLWEDPKREMFDS